MTNGVDTKVLMETLSRFARDLTRPYGISDVLHDLAERVTDVLQLAGAGVTLVEDGQLRFVTSPTELVADLERVQEEHQAGPCVEAARTHRIVTVADIADTAYAASWPAYIEHARRAGVRAVAGIPMLSDEQPLGAMNLYSYVIREWTPDDLQAATLLTDIATAYLVHASALAQQQRTAEQLAEALQSRIVIEQAKGILAATNGSTVDAAFTVLRKHARDRNARIHDVANAVVNLGLRIPDTRPLP